MAHTHEGEVGQLWLGPIVGLIAYMCNYGTAPGGGGGQRPGMANTVAIEELYPFELDHQKVVATPTLAAGDA